MARKTLFGYTRKKIFDGLLLRFTGFEVRQDQAPSTELRFKYFGDWFLSVAATLDGAVILSKYAPNNPRIQKQSATCSTRSEIDAFLFKAFSGFDANARSGLFGKTAQKAAIRRERPIHRRSDDAQGGI